MKSLSDATGQVSARHVEPWNPSELPAEFAAPLTEEHKEQIRAIFEPEAGAVVSRTYPRSVLHMAQDTQQFQSWQPGQIASQSASIRKVDWHLARLQTDMQDTRASVEMEALPKPDRHSDIDKQVASILEQSRRQAEELILSAQNEADNILQLAQDEIDTQKKAGYQESWEQGRREIEETLAATRKMTEAVQAWETDLMAQGEKLLVEMLKEIAQKIFGEGLDLDTNALQVNLNRMMENARGLGNLNIFLNPRDAKVLDPSWSEYQMLVSGGRVKIIPSGKITRGGCFVKGDVGIVDGRVETQLEAILKAFDETSELAE